MRSLVIPDPIIILHPTHLVALGKPQRSVGRVHAPGILSQCLVRRQDNVCSRQVGAGDRDSSCKCEWNDCETIESCVRKSMARSAAGPMCSIMHPSAHTTKIRTFVWPQLTPVHNDLDEGLVHVPGDLLAPGEGSEFCERLGT